MYIAFESVTVKCLTDGLYAIFVACETAEKFFISTSTLGKECSAFPIIGSTL